jgi:hypothetical protein
MGKLRKLFYAIIALFGYRRATAPRKTPAQSPFLKTFRFTLQAGDNLTFSAMNVEAGPNAIIITRAQVWGQPTLYQTLSLSDQVRIYIWDAEHTRARCYQITYAQIEWTQPFLLDSLQDEFLTETVTLREVKYILPDDVSKETIQAYRMLHERETLNVVPSVTA